jgi:hypothetical protein
VRATRFVALAPVGNAGKQKFLHALGLVPASTMSPEQLAQQPDGCTPSPFEMAAKRPAQEQEVGAQGRSRALPCLALGGRAAAESARARQLP